MATEPKTPDAEAAAAPDVAEETPKVTPAQEYKAHRFADFLPMMSERELEDLKKSIQSTGLQEPIVLYEGKILDGRNRCKACLDLGLNPRFSEVKIKDDQEAIDYVITRNLQRRNLTASQKAVVALRALPEIQKTVQEDRIQKIREAIAAKRIKEKTANLPSSDQPEGGRGRKKKQTTVSIVGDLFGVSATYVRYAEALRRKDKKLLDRVIQGKERLYQAFVRVCPEQIRLRSTRGRPADPIGTPLNRLIRLVEKKGTMPDVLRKLKEAKARLETIKERGKPGDAAPKKPAED